MYHLARHASERTKEVIKGLVEAGELEKVVPPGRLYGYEVPVRVIFGRRKASRAWVVIKTGRSDPGNIAKRLKSEIQALIDHAGMHDTSWLPDESGMNSHYTYVSAADIGLEKAVREALGYTIGESQKAAAWKKFLFNSRRKNFSPGAKEFVLTTQERIDFIKAHASDDITEIINDPEFPPLPDPPTGRVTLEWDSRTVIVSEGLKK